MFAGLHNLVKSDRESGTDRVVFRAAAEGEVAAFMLATLDRIRLKVFSEKLRTGFLVPDTLWARHDHLDLGDVVLFFDPEEDSDLSFRFREHFGLHVDLVLRLTDRYLSAIKSLLLADPQNFAALLTLGPFEFFNLGGKPATISSLLEELSYDDGEGLMSHFDGHLEFGINVPRKMRVGRVQAAFGTLATIYNASFREAARAGSGRRLLHEAFKELIACGCRPSHGGH